MEETSCLHISHPAAWLMRKHLPARNMKEASFDGSVVVEEKEAILNKMYKEWTY